MFYLLFLGPQVKRCVIITYKDGIHDLPKDVALRILGKYEILENSLNFIE